MDDKKFLECLQRDIKEEYDKFHKINESYKDSTDLISWECGFKWGAAYARQLLDIDA